MSAIERLKLIEELTELPSAHQLEHEIIPALGINGNMMQLMPERFAKYRDGMCLQQYPSQLAHFWRFLLQHDIASYLEIGVWTGGMFASTIAWLERFSMPIVRAAAVDIDPPKEQMQEYLTMNKQAEFHQFDTRTKDFADWIADQEFDLVLIDGDHSEEGVRNDYGLVKERAKIIAFHDLYNIGCPGVESVFKNAVREWPKAAVFCQQYPEVWIHGQSHAGFGVVYA